MLQWCHHLSTSLSYLVMQCTVRRITQWYNYSISHVLGKCCWACDNTWLYKSNGLTIDCQSFLLAQVCSQYSTCVLLYYGSSVTAAHQVKEHILPLIWEWLSLLKHEQYVGAGAKERPTYQWYTKSVNKYVLSRNMHSPAAEYRYGWMCWSVKFEGV